MLVFLGFMTTAGGLFLFLWYRTLAGLPLKQQPQFARAAPFKWGMPALSLIILVAGACMLAALSARLAVIALGAAAGGAFLVIRFDRYTAGMRLIHDRYRKVRLHNPGMEETEALFHTAAWRYPNWSHDRLVELVAGKNIEELALLMIVQDYGINPLGDWELYSSLKKKAARMARSAR